MATFSLFPSLLFILTAALTTTTTTTAQVTNFYCLGNTTYSANTPFYTNLQTALSTLSAAASTLKSSNATVSSVQALYFCRHDLPLSTCHVCVSNATTYVIRSCPGNTEAVIWYEHCTLRYAARQILGHADTSPLSPYFWQWGGGKVFLQIPDYNRTVETTLQNVIDLASSSNGSDHSYFATEEGVYSKYQKVRCLVQCSPDISAGDCGKCLKAALNLTESHCLGASWGMVFKEGCMLRFGVAPFYSEGSSSDGAGAGAPAASASGGLSSSTGSSSVVSSSSVKNCHSYGDGAKRVLLGMLLFCFVHYYFDLM